MTQPSNPKPKSGMTVCLMLSNGMMLEFDRTTTNGHIRVTLSDSVEEIASAIEPERSWKSALAILGAG